MIKLSLPFKKKEEKPTSVLGLRKLNKRGRASKRKVFYLSPLFFIFLLILSIFFLIKKNPFQIKVVNFRSADLSCVSNEQLRNYLNLKSYNFFNLDGKSLEQKVKEKFICVSVIKIERKIPSTVEVSANDRKLAAIIKVFQLPEIDLNLEEATSSTQAAKLIDTTYGASELGNFIVDTEGVVLKPQDGTSNLPVIEYYNLSGKLRLGSRLPAGLIPQTLKVLNGLNQQGINFENLKIVDNGLFVRGEKELVFPLDKDIERQLAALQLILQKAKMDTKQVNKVDLRFDKAIVVYSAQK